MVTIRYGDDELDLFYDPGERISSLLIHAMAVFAADIAHPALFQEDGTMLNGLLEAWKFIVPWERLTLGVAEEVAA